MTFKANYEIIGYVNELGADFGMLVRWALKHVYTK